MNPLFLMLVGGFSLDWLVNMFNNTGKESFVNVVDERTFKHFVPFVKEWELLRPNAYYATADEKSRGIVTIGYGSTNWLRPDGSIIKPVRIGDTITKDEAGKQLQYYYVRLIPALNAFLQFNKIWLKPAYLGAVLNFVYMYGPNRMLDTQGKNLLLDASGKNERDSALILRNNVLSRLKSFKDGYKQAGLGWSRRLSMACDMVIGQMKNRAWYDANVKKAY